MYKANVLLRFLEVFLKNLNFSSEFDGCVRNPVSWMNTRNYRFQLSSDIHDHFQIGKVQ